MASSTVDKELETLIRARYPIIYIVSWEEQRVEDALREIARERGKKIFFWTVTQGMVQNPAHRDNATRDPIAALDAVIDSREAQALFVLKDYHAFMSDVTVTRRLRDLTAALKTSYKTLIILAPVLKLPSELEKDIAVVDYGLPDHDDLDVILERVVQAIKDNPQIDANLSELERDYVLKAALGLTANEAENVFAKSLIQKHKFDVDVILSEKEQIIRKSGILEYYPFNEKISDVGGLDLLKQWMEKRTVAFSEKARDFGLPAPRGVLLLGVQGCGKSLSAKAIGALWRLPLLRLDVGRIFGGIVGQSEENMRKAIRVAESVAPCVAGDTLVTLADGSERTIEALYNGDQQSLEVLAMTDDWQLAPTPVQAVTRRIAPDLYTVKTQHSSVQATGNHLFPVLRDGELVWVRTDELLTTDYIAMPQTIPTRADMPSMIDFLPENTRLYAPAQYKDCMDVIPIGRKLYSVRQALEVGLDHFQSADSCLLHLYENGKAHPNRQRLQEIVAELRAWAEERHLDTTELAQIEALANSPVSWSRIQSVERAPTPEYVYDLCCVGNHNFCVNNLFSHNCILWVDELEKGFSGTQSSGSSDGGTTSRVFGTFLTWMQDKKAAAFVVATSNDVTSLPPELLRKGRFDEIFFIDLPAHEERQEIFRIHLQKRKRNPDDFDLDRLAAVTPGFSGAEIAAAVEDALYDAFDEDRPLTTESIIAAASHTVPLSMTMRERIEDLREWATTRARDASSAHSESMQTIAEQLALAKLGISIASNSEEDDKEETEEEVKEATEDIQEEKAE